MKKIYSLIRACMTSDMNLFKIKQKKGNKKNSFIFPIILSLCLMFSIWTNFSIMFEKIAPLHLQIVLLSIFIFFISIMTIIEGIYKSSSLLFNCKDDQLLLSLPIKRRTVVFVRIFKFYVFELMFNSLLMIPLLASYIKWCDFIDWTFYVTSFIMLIILPIIPIAISCIIGAIISSISSRFKFKSLVQTISAFAFLLIILYISMNIDNVFEYLSKNASSINDIITKLYYPAGAYAKLVTNFNIVDLIEFLAINIGILLLTVYGLSKFYFKINTRLKSVTTTKKINVDDLVIKSKSKKSALIKKELNTFFKTPVFIINSGFGLIIFILGVILINFKYDDFIVSFTSTGALNVSKDLIDNNRALLIFALIAFTSFMTCVTNSVISLEGRNINILKSLPIDAKTILISKVYFGLLLTTPVLLIGNIILFIKFNLDITQMILLLILCLITPLISHFFGLIINLKYPKLDAENSTEIVKQSMSSFISVMFGMLLLIITFVIITKIVGKIHTTLLLLLFTLVYLIIDVILYFYLIKRGVKDFNNLSI